MWLPLIFFLLLLTIAFYQSTLGLFSALIMTALTICCASAALGSYEWVAIHWLAPHWKPSFACAISLAALFGIPLIILRVVLDRLVRRSCLLPAWADRAGAACCGLVTSFVLVGVVAHAVLMTPFSYSILGFSPVTVVPQADRSKADVTPPAENAENRGLWLTPDRFALAVANMTSSGIFSGEHLLWKDHPDPVEASGWLNATHMEVSRFAPPKSISIVRTEIIPFVYNFKPGDPRAGTPPNYEPKSPTAGREFRMIRVRLGRNARDENKSHIFNLRQFRLVGHSPGAELEIPEQFLPVAIQQPDATQATNRHIKTTAVRGKDWSVLDDIYLPRDGNNDEVEIVFELPARFKPTFLEYKKCARAEVKFDPPEKASQAPPTPPPPARVADAAAQPSAPSEPAPPRDSNRRRRRRPRNTESNETSDQGSGARVRGLVARPGVSFFGDEMPMTMKAYRGLRDTQISRRELQNGHLVGFVDAQESGSNQPVEKFDVPSDKRLLHLNTGRLHARSLFGQALARATDVVQNYFVEDSRGGRHVLVGKYAVAKVEDRDVVEVQYFPQQAGTVGGLGAFDQVQDRHLENDYELVMLFLVDPGAQIMSFSTGGSATRADDLRGDNLVAPQ